VRKLIVVILVVIALLMLVVPRVVGGMAEQQVGEYIAAFNATASARGGPQITEYSYRRGWFGAHGSQRIVLDHRVDGDPLYLVIESEVQHGPLSGRGIGLAAVHSTFSLVDANESVELPLSAVTRIRLDGSASSLITGNAIDHRFATSNSKLEWGGGELQLEIGANGRRIAADGRIDKLLFAQNDSRFTFGPMQLTGEQQQSLHRFWLGDSNFDIAELGLVDATEGALLIERLGFESSARLEQDRLFYSFLLKADRVATPQLDEGRINVSVGLAGLDVEAAARVRDKYARETAATTALTEPDWPRIEADLLALFADGGRLDVGRFFFGNNSGRIDASAHLEFGPTAGATMLVEVLLALDAEVDIVVSKDLLAKAAESNPQLAQATAMLFATGFLLEKGEDFVLRADYKDGLLTVNDLPFPLPLPVR
jgi:uncharacterized protein YdgA (DUF945 family)